MAQEADVLDALNACGDNTEVHSIEESRLIQTQVCPHCKAG